MCAGGFMPTNRFGNTTQADANTTTHDMVEGYFTIRIRLFRIN